MKTAVQKVKEEKVSVTLTLGEVDALISAARFYHENLATRERLNLENPTTVEDLVGALQKLDEAVNL